MRTRWFALTLLLAAPLSAQRPVTPGFELRPMVGAFIPTGDQRDVMKDAAMYGAQLGIEVRPTLHLLGSFAWSPSHEKFGHGRDGVDVFQYDLGAEFNLLRSLGGGWDVKPFLGAGAGARTYRYEAVGLDTKTCLAGYGAVGTEFQYKVAALRLEARDYVYCYRYPNQDLSKTRNEIGLSFGVAYHFGHLR